MKKLVLLLLTLALTIANTVSAEQNPLDSGAELAKQLLTIQQKLGQSGKKLIYLRIDVHDCSMEKYEVRDEDGVFQMILEETYEEVGTPKIRDYPRGKALITAIEKNPWWYPTDDTVTEFKKRGISLEKFRNDQGKIAVPPGNKLNFMGPVKMRLEFIDKQKTAKLRRAVYRIHGNTNPKKLGTRCTGGCIRMDNEEVKELSLDVKGKTVIVEYI